MSSKPALLSLIPEHSDSYVPKSLDPELPIVLSNLFDKHLADADFPCLLEKAEEVVDRGGSRKLVKSLKSLPARAPRGVRGHAPPGNFEIWTF